ncbi:Cyclic AMP-responsive element-binding protein 3-like protein 2, partial [Xenoophorus captivus]
HFSELLDELSPDALLGQLLSDPFLSEDKGGVESMEGEDGGELSPSSPLPPHITAEHSYSLCGDSRPQSPLSHLTGEHGSEAGGTRVQRGSARSFISHIQPSTLEIC